MYVTVNSRGYAYAYRSFRDETGKVRKDAKCLGWAVDKEKGIYRNKKLGLYTYDPKTDTTEPVPAGYAEPIGEFRVPHRGRQKEKLILDFGDAWAVSAFMEKTGIAQAARGTKCKNPDLLSALVCYYILEKAGNSLCEQWFTGSAARLLWPGARPDSQRVSALLGELGEEEMLRGFLDGCLKLVKERSGVIVDSTGLPNSIHFPLTAVSSHNGEISEEARLIYVVQQHTGLPLYFRYCPGNVIDVTTLQATFEELRALGISTKFALLDAGYGSDENFRYMFDSGISFVTRVRENRSEYREGVSSALENLQKPENLVHWNGRSLYIASWQAPMLGGEREGWFYLCQDLERKGIEDRKLMKDHEGLSSEEFCSKMARHGLFMLVSSRRIAPESLLETYYVRQEVEQIFDVAKNEAGLLPLAVHDEKHLRGHLLVTFIAVITAKLMQDALKDSSFSLRGALMALRNQKCKVFAKNAVMQERTKEMKEIAKLLGIACPLTLPIGEIG